MLYDCQLERRSVSASAGVVGFPLAPVDVESVLDERHVGASEVGRSLNRGITSDEREDMFPSRVGEGGGRGGRGLPLPGDDVVRRSGARGGEVKDREGESGISGMVSGWAVAVSDEERSSDSSDSGMMSSNARPFHELRRIGSSSLQLGVDGI